MRKLVLELIRRKRVCLSPSVTGIMQSATLRLKNVTVPEGKDGGKSIALGYTAMRLCVFRDTWA